ncbi:MAG: hypothetical protein K8F34_07135 [Candidatus Kuenenia stuttgartiensis]|uniref:Uncharacterized protein n=2 Tax=Kuenenia stuttgartiensis TaxID=174633 RepID=A0A2C9CGW5_KUEST|nr:hypothetical protein [Candidatus Kuenenia stuttgartiensis]MBZ0191452.1 hypothetical protein [Candidatus Kuenenia stuttgartiensis]MCL4727189.1 hypothetical protein [Candidatus Kuenenia stuttgartiensis]SOH04803.1 hypothetical protein KSMBR1_2308 [Candidatus Kuenenia stuttgartiensis]
MLGNLKNELFQLLEKYFPSIRIDSKEKRGIILEVRAHIDEATFIVVYANAITGKRSFALISKGERIIGYDNYKFWHYHPPGEPNSHIPCDEPSIESIILEFKAVQEKY